MRSLVSLTGSDGCANSTSGVVVTSAMGVKSVSTSKATFLCSHFASTHDKERVSVGRGLRDGGGADEAACARPVLYHDRLWQPLLQFLRNDPRYGVHAPSGSNGSNEGDGAPWIALPPCAA